LICAEFARQWRGTDAQTRNVPAQIPEDSERRCSMADSERLGAAGARHAGGACPPPALPRSKAGAIYTRCHEIRSHLHKEGAIYTRYHEIRSHLYSEGAIHTRDVTGADSERLGAAGARHAGGACPPAALPGPRPPRYGTLGRYQNLLDLWLKVEGEEDQGRERGGERKQVTSP
jgi:hypothetical protein